VYEMKGVQDRKTTKTKKRKGGGREEKSLEKKFYVGGPRDCKKTNAKEKVGDRSSGRGGQIKNTLTSAKKRLGNRCKRKEWGGACLGGTVQLGVERSRRGKRE